MTSLVDRPITIKVTTNVQGIPLKIHMGDRIERITKIYQHWTMPDESSPKDDVRHYYRVGTNKFQAYDIYRDPSSGMWFLDRIHL